MATCPLLAGSENVFVACVTYDVPRVHNNLRVALREPRTCVFENQMKFIPDRMEHDTFGSQDGLDE